MPHRGIRVLSLNVAHGRGLAFHQTLASTRRVQQNLDAIARVVAATGVDVVALQELDAPSSWSGEFDHLAYLADRTGLAHLFHGLHMNLRTPRLAYGTGVLSRWPLAGGTTRRFGQNALDTKGYVRVRVAGPGAEVDLVSLHLDFKRDKERRAQLALLSQDLHWNPPRGPLVVAGDFNTTPERTLIPEFMQAHTLRASGSPLHPTFPSVRPRRRIDEVLVSEHFEVRHHEVVDVQVSDHLPVLAELRA